MSAPYDIIIGLETHVQLLTESKLFCRCSARFGADPNTQTCPVCIGLPGALPVMNREAFRLSLLTAIALNCNIPHRTKWDRKQYYYPDLPKGYQISQFDLPMSADGYLEISDEEGRFPDKRVGIIRAHLEEDAGKSMHDEQAGKGDSRIDLNRTGTPLLEIVTEPDLRSALEARTYLRELKLLLTYLGVSDCNMQEGSLRVDANINLHIPSEEGEKIATPIVEVKNMNSFRAVERALLFEAERQWKIWQETGQRLGDLPKQTRGWDEQAEITRAQRSKEESSDYRYFPDPDLVPVEVATEEVEEVRNSLEELPADMRRRLIKEQGIARNDAEVIVSQGRLFAVYYETLAQACGDGRQASNWVQQSVMRAINEQETDIESLSRTLPASSLAELLRAITKGEIDNNRAKDVFTKMQERGLNVPSAMSELGIVQVDEGDLVELCRSLLEDNPKIVADLKEGNLKAAGALIGQAKKRNPNINPGRLREICIDLVKQS